MRHRKSRLQLNRFTSWYKATLRSLARSLVINQSIKTTLHKAKAAKPFMERLISLAKRNTVAARREAFKSLGSHKLVSLLFNEIGPRFEKRQGGYSRIIILGNRRGDNAQLAILELTEIKKKEIKKSKKDKEKEIKPEKEKKPEVIQQEMEQQEKKPETGIAVKEKPQMDKKPTKKFLGGLRGIFRKERRDSL